MKSPALKILLAGIFLSAIAFSSKVPDSTLLPRLLLFSVTAATAFLLILKSKNETEWSLPVFIYAAYCIFNGAGIFYAINSAEAIFETSRATLGFFCFLLAAHFLKNNRELFYSSLQKIAIVLVLSGVALAAWQSRNYSASNKDSIYLITGLSGHKNLFASFLFLNLFFFIRAVDHKRSIWKYLRLLTIVVTLTTLIALRTKAVYIGLAVSGILYLVLILFRAREFSRLKVTALVISLLLITNLFILYAAPVFIKNALEYNSELSSEERKQKELDNERLMLWQKTYGLYDKNKLFGVGPGNWQINFPDETLNGMWRAEDLNFTFQRPHNDLLWILSETGLTGFNLYFLFIFFLLVPLLKSAVKDRNEFRTARVVIAFVMGYFVISFFDFPKERMEHIIFLNLILAGAYNLSSEEPVYKKYKLSPKFNIIPIVLSLLILTVIIFRLKGELYLMNLYEARYKNEQAKVLLSAEKANSMFYNLDPTSVPLKWYSGNAHASAGNFEKAFKDFRQAAFDNPYNRNVLNDLGSAYAMLRKNDSAKHYYLEVIRISPRFDDAKLNLAALYIGEQKFKSADSVLQTLLHDSPRRTEYQNMLNILLGKQR